MRGCLAKRAALAAAAALASSVLGPGEVRAQGETRTYIAPGSEVRYASARAPLPARQLGAIAVATVERVRDAVATGEVPSVLGVTAESGPPVGWPARLDGASVEVGRAPLAAADEGMSCRCATDLGDTSRERVAVLYAARSFMVGPDLSQVSLLRLRARYNDSLVAYINGQEVARRNLDPAAGPMDIAVRPHGPEWETFYIPVVPGLLRLGENVLAVEVRPSGNRLAPYLDLALEATESAALVRGPMVQRVGRDSATVVFETDHPVKGEVAYGPTAEYGRVARSAGGGLAMRHVVELDGLPADGQAVHYRVRAGDIETPDYVLHTAPKDGGILRVAVYGDVRGGHDVHAQVADAMLAEAPDLVIATGDLVMRGSDEGDWQRFFQVTEKLLPRVPLYPAAGNHDTGRSGDQGLRMNEVFEFWPGPEDRPEWGHWYSFDISGVHFVMLDSNSYESQSQLEWLERDLADARQRGVRAIFAVAHHGAYSRGLHGGSAIAAESYVPLLRRYDTTLMFSGHDHLYQRGEVDGFRYMVSGGGGAPLYSARCGVPGKKRCKERDGMRTLASEYHYIMVTVYPRHAEACAKRPDGSPLEPCLRIRLPRRR